MKSRGASARMPVNNEPTIEFVINLIRSSSFSVDKIAAGAVKKNSRFLIHYQFP
jgi:hypothetical protein